MKKENCKREENLKCKGGRDENEWMSDFLFSFHFLKPLKFVWVYQNSNFYREKAFHTRKKIWKSDFTPEKYSSYATGYGSCKMLALDNNPTQQVKSFTPIPIRNTQSLTFF